MQYFDLNQPDYRVDFAHATREGLGPSGGLFMPVLSPGRDLDFFKNIRSLPIVEKALHIARYFVGDCIAEVSLRRICNEAFNFPVPIHYLNNRYAILELFHGPSLAFKDFGARFMSRIMVHLQQQQGGKLHVLVATSGDTGGAVAMGFHNLPGVRVTILFPKGKVSYYQRLQLTRLGANVQALEIDGTFDDCQALVKACFNDSSFRKKHGLTSANSINISRLIPQSVYYAHAIAQLPESMQTVLVVPSGNFGNITAGLLAWKLGMPVTQFVAAVNANKVFPEYLKTGIYRASNTVATLSNAMDVGNPSNFVRLERIFNDDINAIKQLISSYSVSDSNTLDALNELYRRFGYASEPHTAVAWHALQQFEKDKNISFDMAICLGTAHPAKFFNELPDYLKTAIKIPEALSVLERQSENVQVVPNDIVAVKKVLDQA